MTRKHKKLLRRTLCALVLFLCGLLPVPELVRFALYLSAYLTAGWDVLWRASRSIVSGQVFDESFLMSVATLGAFACREFPEAAAVMVFYQIGELFQSVAVHRSRRSIASLMDIRPDHAEVQRDGAFIVTAPEEVAVDDLIRLRPGDRVPLDGIVEQGECTLDTAALTGESIPRPVRAGDTVLSGCVDLDSTVLVRVTKPYEQSTVSRILELVETSGEKKAKAEHFITKFARWYTPTVVGCAVLLAAIPPLAGLGVFSDWLHRALVFLVVSCPCALVISIPLSFFGGIGGASRQGVLVKGGNYLEAMADAGIAVLDKTGTLTDGALEVSGVFPVEMTQEALLTLSARAERFSAHPIAASIRQACPQAAELPDPTEVREEAGYGVQSLVDGTPVWVGRRIMLEQAGISVPPAPQSGGAAVFVAVDGAYAGMITAADHLKPTAAEALRQLKQAGVRRTVMLTGDRQDAADAAASALGIDEIHAELLPDGKVAAIESLLADKRRGEQLVFVGDGINDAPVLARADVGVAMGAMGSDAAIEAADVVLMDDDPRKLALAIRIARRTLRIVRENIVFALAVKFLVLLASALGYAGMWMAVFADVGVCVIAILNAGRMLLPTR